MCSTLGRTRHYFRVAEKPAVAVRLLGRKLEADQRLDEKKDLVLCLHFMRDVPGTLTRTNWYKCVQVR